MGLFLFSPGKQRKQRDIQIGLGGPSRPTPFPPLRTLLQSEQLWLHQTMLTSTVGFIWNTSENGGPSKLHRLSVLRHRLWNPHSNTALSTRAHPMYRFHYADHMAYTHTWRYLSGPNSLNYNTGPFNLAWFGLSFFLTFYPLPSPTRPATHTLYLVPKPPCQP